MNSTVQAEKFSISRALNFGWQKMKRHLLLFIGLFIVAALVPLVPGLIEEGIYSAARMTEGDLVRRLIAVIASVLQMALSAFMSAGLVRICLDIAHEKAPRFSDLFSGRRVLLKYFVACFLYGAIVFVGLLLFIVPGIIWGIQFMFYGYLVVDKGCGPIEALEKSSALTKGVRWELLGFYLLLFGINFLGLLCLVIGLLVTTTITLIATASAYKQLSFAASAISEAPNPDLPVRD